MNCNINRVITLTAGLLLVVGNSVSALPTIGKSAKRSALKTAASCDPATAVIDLDINNVRARMMTGGDMWWNQGTGSAAYEVPKGSRKNALFAGSCWVGGLQDGSLKVAAQTYRSDGNDYWPGPLNSNNQTFEISRATCNEWDRFWKLDRVLVNEFKQLSDYVAAAEDPKFRTIFEWPARGNGLAAPGNTGESNSNTRKALGSTGAILQMDDREYAPFVDLDGNHIYNPETGDYPNMEEPGRGDQMVWWVFNDRGNTKLQTKSESIGLEIQTTAFAFASKDFLNDATFINYRVINRAGLTLDSAFMATWTDADLGYAFDDYIGCDTSRGLGILYNATPTDGNGEPTSYGANPPMVGVDFFIGPQRYFIDSITGLEDTVFLDMQAFTYFNNLGTGVPPEILDPGTSVEFYNYMTGSKRFGGLFSNDGVSKPCNGLGQGDPVKFVFAGEVNSGWSECVCGNPPGDRRFIHSAGPFQLRPGDVNNIVIGAVWVANAGGCPNASFGKIKIADDLTQELFDNQFKTIEGPWAPRVVYREMDRKLVFYLQNDNPISTNYQEKFGSDIDSAKYKVVSRKAAKLHIADSIYRFEGYRVFQLRSSQITATQIFDEDGRLDETVAKEVFQCDVKNGVKTIRNWSKDVGADDCANCYISVPKVIGKDSGISHSFQVTTDAFATGDEKGLVNYKSYYYVVIAYAFNNFASFNQFAPDSTQDKAYLESQRGYDGKPLEVIVAMPNPANKDMGTTLNSDYGTGVVIKQLEGKGNGGNDVQLSSISEEDALSAANNYQVAQPLYDSGRGPINVKVVDPLKVQPGNWTVYLVKDPSKPGNISYPDLEKGMIPGNVRWQIVKDGDISNPLYAERNLDVLNEQILENYGLSINIRQTLRPGENQDSIERNGYITSDITFADIRRPWLAGVNDEEKQSQLNWIRAGGNEETDDNLPCNYDDNQRLDSFQYFESMLANNALTRGSWAPYDLAAVDNTPGCGFGVAKQNTVGSTPSALYDLQSVDIVFTADKSKWSKCVVVELNDALLSEGGAKKFYLRNHSSWTGDVDASGNPVYGSDMGFSYFPGYAVNQETGERLNIVFGEDSYLKGDNGRDMIWNPSSMIVDVNGNSIFGGRHYIYVSKTKYDGCDSINKLLVSNNDIQVNKVYSAMMWVGLPIANFISPMLPLKDGLIPTTARLRLRVKRPYAYYAPPGVTLDNTFDVAGYPKYQFTTTDLVPYKLSDASNPYSDDKKKLLDRMHVVPNPYYAYNGYEKNRLDTRVRIINLPRKATIHVYSLDGSLIKKLTKDDDLAYIDWDTRNAKGLPIASGMYIVHVKADGIGERVIKWFGAMRPVDITNY